MKILHLADLHIGKMLYGHSLIEDQRHLFELIYQTIEQKQIQAVIIAGDVYDRAVPGTDAVNLLDEFLDQLINVLHVQVLLISGNHDSPARLNFGSRILEKRGLHIASEVPERIVPVVLEDAFGPVYFYLLPFFRKTDLREILNIEERNISLDALLERYLAQQEIDESKRNILVTHTTCIGNMASSEEVGGIEWVSGEAFKNYDYVALGHLHGCHRVSAYPIYYAGSPLKFSIDEANQKKGLVIVELQEKGHLQVEMQDIEPLHDVRVIEGTLNDILEMPPAEDYVFLSLLDKTLQINAADRARVVFKNLLGLTYQHLETGKSSRLHHELKTLQQLSPLDLFVSFYEEMMGQPAEQKVKDIFETYYQEGEAHEN